ncbi:MAG: UDP-4-amino-4,6-dideoxy-N-acetyl-beta-L-altrosamine transaminase [Rhodospirillales bacterium]|nr:UDP-4-amino-4,6-dideoxy-N-acetyl-beta-L-altrosamine transaminase [Rhodospirillales bacterium]
MTDELPLLPYARQMIDDDDIAAVCEVLRSDFLTTGPATRAFEEKLAQVTGAPFAIACSSGTAALHLASLALDLRPGEKVIVPSITFLATANAARYAGAEVVFSDVDADSGLMGPEQLSQALEKNDGTIKAVFPVHLGGQSPDMVAIREIADQNALAVVEDASHAIGGVYSEADGEAAVGACPHSDMTTFSFHPVKTIAMGEGGAITTRDAALAERLRLLLNHGMTRDSRDFVDKDMAFDSSGEANPWYYEMQEMGFNYRASDIHCALGLSQLSKLEQFVDRRRQLAALYDEMLAPLAPLVSPIARTPGGRPAWHLYQVLIDFDDAGLSRADVMKGLRERGIGTQVHYIPVHRQPYYRRLYGDQTLPGADGFYNRCLSLPLFPAMSDTDIDRVVNALTQTLDKGSSQ